MSITVTILGFILTGVIGNYLIHRWQLRNWLTQQKISAIENEHLELKALAEDISTTINERIFSMRSALYALKTDDLLFKELRLDEYRESLKKWNQRYGYFSAKLPLLMPSKYTKHFDEEIHGILVKTSRELDKGISSGKIIPQLESKIENNLSYVNGNAIRLTNEIFQSAKHKRNSIHKETIIPYNIENINKFSTWQLIKALFIKDINRFSVIRSPLEP